MPIHDIKTRNEAIEDVLWGLQWLIQHHATVTASEQYAPTRHADAMDDHIKEHKEWVESLRKIRTDFENLVTGLIE